MVMNQTCTNMHEHVRFMYKHELCMERTCTNQQSHIESKIKHDDTYKIFRIKILYIFNIK